MASRFIDGLGESGNGKNDNGFDEENFLVVETNKLGESWNIGSKSNFAEMVEWDNDFMLDLIGKDLDWRFGCVDKEMKGGKGLQSRRGNNRVGSALEGLDLINPACPRGVNSLRGGQDLIDNEMMPGLKSLANTFSPDEVVGFVNFVATHPSREVGALHIAQKKVELNAFNRWRGRNHLPSLEEFGELVDDEKGGRNDYEKVNKVQSNNRRSRGRPPLDVNRYEKKKKRISS